MQYAQNPKGRSFAIPLSLTLLVFATPDFAAFGQTTQPTSAPAVSSSRLSDQGVSQLDTQSFPKRPKPIIELGNPFFGSGNISDVWTLPTGEVWTPTFIVYGTYRSAFQAFENPGLEKPGAEDKPRSEWANRLDLYGNLQLSGTERVLIGFRPLDDGVFNRPQQARYTGYNFSPSNGSEAWVDPVNARITTLFFEGDFGQIFPHLDPFDTKQLDIGFSVGRQPLLYQDGIFIDDDVDAVGLTRNTFIPKGTQNLQITAVYAWGQVNRGDGINHKDPGLLGLFFNSDFAHTTWNLDTAYDFGSGQHANGIYGALSATRRFGELNSTIRVLGSKALESHVQPGNSPLSYGGYGTSAVGTGVLLFSELSWTVPHTRDLLYFDGYWGIDRFTSAARGPDRGGPLGRVGILFAEQPIGRYGSALSSNPERSAGAVLGYQMFLDAKQRKQLILEVGGRAATDSSPTSAAAVGARYQQALGQNVVLQFDLFTALNEAEGFGYGGRMEVRVEF